MNQESRLNRELLEGSEIELLSCAARVAGKVVGYGEDLEQSCKTESVLEAARENSHRL